MERREEHWHLSKSISIGHLMTTLAVVLSGVLYVGDIDTQVQTQAVEIKAIRDAQSHERKITESMFSRLREDMKSIGEKLDKLIDRELRKADK